MAAAFKIDKNFSTILIFLKEKGVTPSNEKAKTFVNDVKIDDENITVDTDIFANNYELACFIFSKLNDLNYKYLIESNNVKETQQKNMENDLGCNYEMFRKCFNFFKHYKAKHQPKK